MPGHAMPVDIEPVPEVLPAQAGDGARHEVLLVRPAGHARTWLLWLPAMGVPARHYLPLAQALAARGAAVAIHEWRGIGASDRRAGRASNWGYRELLTRDLPASLAACRRAGAEGAIWLGGHSLGGQLACLFAGLHPGLAAGLLLVASGVPYWRTFPRGRALWLAFVLAPWLAALRGHLPGRRLGFAGNEARGVIGDWARSGRTGRYAAHGMAQDLDAALGRLAVPVLGLRLGDDWLVPPASLDGLLARMPLARTTQRVLDAAALGGGVRADHFAWMRSPEGVAAAIEAWWREGNSAFARSPQVAS